MLAEDLNGLVNNQIIAQVSDRPDPTLFPKGKDTEWIKPGRSVFTWLTEGNDRLSVANHKKYVDGAAELGQECRHLGMAPFLFPFGQQDRHRAGRCRRTLRLYEEMCRSRCQRAED